VALKTLVDLVDNQVASMMAASVADHKTLVVSAQQDLAHKAQLPHF
jgi:hypothetical protein